MVGFPTRGNSQYYSRISDDDQDRRERPAYRSKQFREDLGLGNGAPFAVLRLGDGLILLPEQQRFEQLCEQVSTSLSRAGLTSDDLLATLPAARDRVYARRYGTKSSPSAARRRSRTHRKK